jgi:hypothetical protein
MHVNGDKVMQRRNVLLALLSVTGLVTCPAYADDVKKECVDAATLGQTRRDEGKLLAARDQMVRCARDECTVMKSFCARWLTEIEQQIPSVVVRVVDSDGTDRTDAKATVDGRPVKLDGKPTLLDPGEHLLVIEAPSAPRKAQKVLLVDREKSRLINIQLPSKKQGQASSTPADTGGIPTGVWVLGGIGVAALGTGTYFGLQARSQLEHLKTECSPDCPEERTKPGRTDALLADISFGVGAAAVVVAIMWAAFTPQDKAPQKTGNATLDVRPVAGGWAIGTSFSY